MPKLTVDRFSFCKIENAVKMLSDGYSRFFPKQVFSKSNISAQNASDVQWNIEKCITQKLTCQHRSRLVLSLVSGFSMDRRHAPFRICSDSRPQSPSFLSHVVLRVRDFGLFWFGIGYDFRGNYGSVWTYLSFQFKMSKKSLRKKEKYANSK